MASHAKTTLMKPLNWKKDINAERSLPLIDWRALKDYAIRIKLMLTNVDDEISCQLSSEYNMGGLHVVRRLDFQDGTSWVARLQLQTTADSPQRLIHEVCTTRVIREQSAIPVPEIFAYESNCDNDVGVAFMLMEYIPADTAMDSFGGYPVHKGKTPPEFKTQFYATMARIQVEIASVRFPQIGSVIQCSDGIYSVGPIPGIGGPFDSAADFFKAWVQKMKFPYNENTIRERTPAEYVHGIIESIKEFPLKLSNLAQRYRFEEGPFPIVHTDLYKSNVLVDSEYRVQGVIDWENAITAPWEMVEFMKDLSIIPPMMDGPLYHEDSHREVFADRMKYIEVVKKTEHGLHLDSKLSTTFENWNTQNLASAIWLYPDGRIGFYSSVLESFE
jgi:hypothetical protein